MNVSIAAATLERLLFEANLGERYRTALQAALDGQEPEVLASTLAERVRSTWRLAPALLESHADELYRTDLPAAPVPSLPGVDTADLLPFPLV